MMRKATGRSRRRSPLLLLLFLTLILVVVNASNWVILSRVTETLDEQLGLRLTTVASAAVKAAELPLLVGPNVAEDVFVRRQLEDIAERHDLEDVFLVDPEGVMLFDRHGSGLGERNPFLDLDRVAFEKAVEGTASSSPALETRGTTLKAAYAPVENLDGSVAAVLGITAGGGFYRQVPALRRTVVGVSIGSAVLVVFLGALFFGMTRRLSRTEAALARAETLSSMGMMAAGIAHEVRNPLSIIAGTAQRLKRKYGQAGDDSLFEFIPDEVERLNRIVEGYLRFAQDDPLAFERCDLGAVVERSGLLVEDEFASRGVHVKRHAPDRPLPVRADPRRLQQVLLNLLLNGAQAMPDGGEIDVHVAGRGRRAEIRVSDRGTGLSSRQLRDAFEPFFTTKEKGSGLGLVLAKRIVEAHRGTIALANREGGGATVTVDLPLEDGSE